MSSRPRSPSRQGSRPTAKSRTTDLTYFATAAKGTEGLLRAELLELGIRPVRGDRGGVHFGGTEAEAFRVCLWSRLAIRVLQQRLEAEVRSAEELYAVVREHDVDDLLDPSRTLAVSAAVRSSTLTHSQYVSRRVKDAIVDRQRERLGVRSSVSAEDPDVHFFVRLAKNRLTLAIDLSGAPLHRRGYREGRTTAPIKENLAAALLRMAGYDGSAPLIDPCCGSGTILCESAMVALRRAPGLNRSQFGMERLRRVTQDDRQRFDALRAEARRAGRHTLAAPIAGGDIDLEALSAAQRSIAALGVDVALSRWDVLTLPPLHTPGLLVTNPPYGVRLDGGDSFDRRLGKALRRWKGHRLVILTQGGALARAMGKPPDFEHTLFNGALECRALGWDLR